MSHQDSIRSVRTSAGPLLGLSALRSHPRNTGEDYSTHSCRLSWLPFDTIAPLLASQPAIRSQIRKVDRDGIGRHRFPSLQLLHTTAGHPSHQTECLGLLRASHQAFPQT
jgi:hypothetical protein